MSSWFDDWDTHQIMIWIEGQEYNNIVLRDYKHNWLIYNGKYCKSDHNAVIRRGWAALISESLGYICG